VDTSVYNQDIPIKCPTLLITVPGFTYSVQYTDIAGSGHYVTINPGFIINLTACDLEIQTLNCGTIYNDLPDGIYAIKYSVSPNEYVFVEYNHLRITKALYKYQALLCDLDLAACDPLTSVKDKLNQLRLIRMYLEAAKSQVEFCHHAQKGMELYNYAVKLLDKMDCSTCI
jgi:hypothetical protein